MTENDLAEQEMDRLTISPPQEEESAPSPELSEYVAAGGGVSRELILEAIKKSGLPGELRKYVDEDQLDEGGKPIPDPDDPTKNLQRRTYPGVDSLVDTCYAIGNRWAGKAFNALAQVTQGEAQDVDSA